MIMATQMSQTELFIILKRSFEILLRLLLSVEICKISSRIFKGDYVDIIPSIY